jgi:hypothetical protein
MVLARVRVISLAPTFVHEQRNHVDVHEYQSEPMHMAVYLCVGYSGSRPEIRTDLDDSIGL